MRFILLTLLVLILGDYFGELSPVLLQLFVECVQSILVVTLEICDRLVVACVALIQVSLVLFIHSLTLVIAVLQLSSVLGHKALLFLTMVSSLFADGFVVPLLDLGQLILKRFDHCNVLSLFFLEKAHIVFLLFFKSSVMLTLDLLNFGLVVFVTFLDFCMMLFTDLPNLTVVSLLHIGALFFSLDLEGLNSLLVVLFSLVQIRNVTLVSLIHRAL